jgi:hypothetical protein
MHRDNIFQRGGNKPFNIDPDTLNRFTSPSMERIMNPVYGLYYAENGYFANLYFLNKSKLLDIFIDNFSKLFDKPELFKTNMEIHTVYINKICTENPGTGTIRPNNDIMSSKFTPLDLGRYIATKYIIASRDKEFVVKKTNRDFKIHDKYKITNRDEINTIISSTRFNKYINLYEKTYFAFDMILFCLWWKADNQDGIDNYYKGIEDVFEIFNKYNSNLPTPKPSPIPIPSASASASESASTSASTSASANASESANATSARTRTRTNKSFEKLAIEIIRPDFMLYPYEHAEHFCKDNRPFTYPDCGEIAVRNIINILCFNGTNFDIEILKKKGAIKEVIDYYTVFNNFNLQSDPEPTEIFGMNLNSRDAWSKLVIDKSQHNIVFNKNCANPEYGYDMKGGLSKDGKKPNLLQMLNNLLNGIVEWNDLTTDGNITKITTNKNTHTHGVGKVNIKNIFNNSFIVDLKEDHYNTELTNKRNVDNTKYDHITNPKHKNMLEILLKKVKKENCVEINFTSDEIVLEFRYTRNLELKAFLFILSLTERYDRNTRREMIIHVDGESFFSKTDNESFFSKIAECGNIENINDYLFTKDRPNFEFVRRLPALRALRIFYTDDFFSNVSSIDLSPLKNIVEIEYSFLYNCPNVKTIDLRPLSNIRKIGNDFLNGFENLETIDLTPLSNVEKIGNSFMGSCIKIQEVDLSSLTKLTEIGNDFLENISKIKKDDFLENISKIKKVDLSSSPLITIGTNFLHDSEVLHTIKFNKNPTITSIGRNFMYSCKNLVKIDLRCLRNITFINDYFLSKCSKLETIDFSCLSKVTKIGQQFLENAAITSADLSSLTKLRDVGSFFMVNCKNLETVISPFNYKIEKKNGNFHGCDKLKKITQSDSEITTPGGELTPLALSAPTPGDGGGGGAPLGGGYTLGGKRSRTTRKNKKNFKKSTRKRK